MMFNLIRPISRNGLIGVTMAKRTVVYAKGTRVRGAIRDPEEIFTSRGVKYGLTDENLKHIKNYFSTELHDKYPLSDKLCLQILTHKSFAHGTQPYNEKLAQIGEQLVRFYTAKYAIKQANNSEYSIQNLNFDCLGSLNQKLLASDKILAKFASYHKLDEIFFCRIPMQSPDSKFKPHSMFATIGNSIVGAIATQYGKKAAEEYIETHLMKNLLFCIQNN